MLIERYIDTTILYIELLEFRTSFDILNDMKENYFDIHSYYLQSKCSPIPRYFTHNYLNGLNLKSVLKAIFI